MDTAAATHRKPMLRITVEPVDRCEVTVVVHGELDCATVGQLRAAITALLNRGGVTAISLDLRGLGFIDSAGIGTLVVAQRICREVGVQLRLMAVSAFAARLLGGAGVDAALGLPKADTGAAALTGAG
jgi:anti-anti-sigma factor